MKDEFLAHQVSRGGNPSPDQNTRCTCSYTGFDQPVCLENNSLREDHAVFYFVS